MCIHWFPGPYGDAKEAKSGNGVGWFTPNGELLAVEFDDVSKKLDRQELEFSRHRVEVLVKNVKINVKLHVKRPQRKKAA